MQIQLLETEKLIFILEGEGLKNWIILQEYHLSINNFRSFSFAIAKRSPDLEGKTIHNLNVRGKRGNIVQVYPAVEYDFVPNRLVLNTGDYIHFQ